MPEIRPDGFTRPHADRLDPDRSDYAACMQAHDAAVAAGEPGYLDPITGLFVMTAKYLADRDWCCDRGCRHCPYHLGPERLA